MSSRPPGKKSGDSLNTALIGLYTVIGVTFVVFLTIIITRAVCARRHPEHYGRQYTIGRPRQSRAKGIARVMLETIPIVKFSDPNDRQSDVMNADVEMTMDHEERAEQMPKRRNTSEITNTSAQDGPRNLNAETNEENQAAAASGASTLHPLGVPGVFSCPICTDDFVKGQDIRLLPCDHSFHPDCIDPWLVNVSGTCPLCRIDLNPPEGEGERGEEEADNTGGTPQDGEAAITSDEHQGRQRHRLANILPGTLNAHRMRDATVEERVAALRSVQEVNSRREEVPEGRHGWRNRLTSRLRDRFRIRTRRHENTDPPEGS